MPVKAGGESDPRQGRDGSGSLSGAGVRSPLGAGRDTGNANICRPTCHFQAGDNQEEHNNRPICHVGISLKITLDKSPILLSGFSRTISYSIT